MVSVSWHLNSPLSMMSCPSPPLPLSSLSPFLFRRLAIPFLLKSYVLLLFSDTLFSLWSHSFTSVLCLSLLSLLGTSKTSPTELSLPSPTWCNGLFSRIITFQIQPCPWGMEDLRYLPLCSQTTGHSPVFSAFRTHSPIFFMIQKNLIIQNP